jgi:cell division transport system permease protein
MRMLGERPAITFCGVVVVALALALPGCVFMLTQMLGPAVSRLPVAEVTAFVVPGTGASEVKALAGRLEAMDGVARVKPIPRDQAWAELQRRARDAQALSEFKPNPLPDAIAVEFAPRLASASVDAAVTAIAKQPRVESVLADLEWYRRVLGLVQTVVSLLLPVAAAVGLLAVVVVLGLVRAVAVVDAAELRLLDQIGAEVEFMRRPFVYAGATLLGISAAASLGLLALACVLANPPLAELGRRFGLELQLGYPPWPLILSFVAASVLIGASAGSSFGAKQIALAKRH